MPVGRKGGAVRADQRYRSQPARTIAPSHTIGESRSPRSATSGTPEERPRGVLDETDRVIGPQSEEEDEEGEDDNRPRDHPRDSTGGCGSVAREEARKRRDVIGEGEDAVRNQGDDEEDPDGPASLRGARCDEQFAQEARRRRHAREPESKEAEGESRRWDAPSCASELDEIPRSELMLENPGGEERAALHQGVVQDVEEAADQRNRDAVLEPDTEAEQDVPHLRNARVREEALDVPLVHRNQVPDGHLEDGEESEEQPIGKLRGRPDAEDGEGSDHRQEAALGHNPAEHCADSARRRRMGVRKPGVHRDDGRLYTEPDDEEARGQQRQGPRDPRARQGGEGGRPRAAVDKADSQGRG